MSLINQFILYSILYGRKNNTSIAKKYRYIPMPRPRKQQVVVEDTPYYHCMSRCVRRAFLCGNSSNGANYEHRRGFIENRIRLLASIFSIDICSYAIMSNHYHLVVKIESTDDWPMDRVIKHWLILHKGPPACSAVLCRRALRPG